MELRDKPSAGEFEAGEHIIAKEIVMTDFLRGSEKCVALPEAAAIKGAYHVLGTYFAASQMTLYADRINKEQPALLRQELGP